jgi:hypothetical protein
VSSPQRSWWRETAAWILVLAAFAAVAVIFVVALRVAP